MKAILPTIALAIAASTLAWSAQDADSSAAAEPDFQQWEYKIVSMAEIHGSTLDYLKDALDNARNGSLFDKAVEADVQLGQKTEDLLNVLGEEGWDLVEYGSTMIILKRHTQ